MGLLDTTGGALGISAGAGLLSSIGGAIQSRRNTKRTIKAAKEMQQLEWQNNLEQWERENAYNTPAMQMQRLQEAGLNPNLVYGNGSVAGLTSAKSPQYDAPEVDYSKNTSPLSGVGSAISEFQHINLIKAQTDNVKAQNDLIKAQAAKTSVEAAREQFAYDTENWSFGENEYQGPGGYSNLSGLQTARRNVQIRSYQDALRNEKLYSEAQSSSINARRDQELFNDTISKFRLEVDNLKKRGSLYDADTQLRLKQSIMQQLEIDLRELGVTSSDNILFRIAGRLAKSLFPELKF